MKVTHWLETNTYIKAADTQGISVSHMGTGPTDQLNLIKTVLSDAVIALNNVTNEFVPPGMTILQTDVEISTRHESGSSVPGASSFLNSTHLKIMGLGFTTKDILVPLGRFERTNAFLAQMPSL